MSGRWRDDRSSSCLWFRHGSLLLLVSGVDGAVIPWPLVWHFARDMLAESLAGYPYILSAFYDHPASGLQFFVKFTLSNAAPGSLMPQIST